MDYKLWTSNASGPWLSVKHMMNKEYQVIHPGDSLRVIINTYIQSKIDTLPVVDEYGVLVGVFPRGRLYKALLDGIKLDEPCTSYIVDTPRVLLSTLTYDEVSFFARVNRSKEGALPVVDESGRVIGVIGRLEYLRTSLNLATITNALLESIFQGMNEGIITTDKDGYILKINQSIEKMFSINSSEIRGLNINEIFPEIDRYDELVLGSKYTLRSIPVVINQVPIKENGEHIGTNFVIVDLSDMEKIARELEIVKELQTALSGVLSASSDGVFVTDTSGLVKYVNKSAGDLFDKTPEHIIGTPIEDYLHSICPSQVAETGIPEVDVCGIRGRNCIVSHVPFKDDNRKNNRPLGVVSTVYLDDNKVTEEIARKWFSMRQQVQYYRDELERYGGTNKNNFAEIVSKNEEFIRLKREAQRVSRSSSTVLLTGESGVGKDMFARAIHAASSRTRRPFVKVNCAAIPETLFESELFGYAPGSFTGASKQGKTGYFEQAHEGTIFLDEIGDMPLSIQVKILQVIQDKQFMRVGGVKTQNVDVRIIAATNRDLREAIVKGTFREDLFYRLNVIEFHLPPLRERAEDILILADAFIHKYNSILGTKVTGMSKPVKEAFQNHAWPGNIRELENAVERAANYVWDGDIELEHLPNQITQSQEDNPISQSSYRAVIDDVNKEIILDALKKTNGNKSAAARMLKISRSAFYEKLSKYGVN